VTATTIVSVRGSGAVSRVLRSAARGGVLIGIAVVIGIILLQVVDKGGGGGAGGVAPVTAPSHNSTTTSAPGGRAPEEVRVYVLNGSEVANAAATTANILLGLGYIQDGTGNTATQTGTTVACKPGFDEEAKQLAQQLGVKGIAVTVAPYPTTPPPEAAASDCIVIVGK
jgi:LytR cell envelope-related transcriptional attenuator